MIIRPKKQRIYFEFSDGSFQELPNGEYKLENGHTLVYDSSKIKDWIYYYGIFHQIAETLIPLK